MPTLKKTKRLPWNPLKKRKPTKDSKYYNSRDHRGQSIRYRKDNPICEVCSKRGVIKSVIEKGKRVGVMDHIIPIEQGGSKKDPRNLMSMCSYQEGSCHDKKRNLESRDIFVKSIENESGDLIPFNRLEIVKLINKDEKKT